jgi:lipoprotein
MGEMTMKKMCRILACVGTLFLTACTASNNRSTQTTSTSVTEQKKETPEPKETVSPEVTEALHAYNELLDNIDAYDFGMGDTVSDHVTYGIVYLNHDIPQLIVGKFYDAQFIAVAKIFGYDPETQTYISSDAVFQIDNPSQMKLSPSETYGWFTLLQDHKGLVYTENNRSTHEILKIELLTWEDNQLIVKEITKMEFNSLPKEPKLIMLGINDRRLLK